MHKIYCKKTTCIFATLSPVFQSIASQIKSKKGAKMTKIFYFFMHVFFSIFLLVTRLATTPKNCTKIKSECKKYAKFQVILRVFSVLRNPLAHFFFPLILTCNSCTRVRKKGSICSLKLKIGTFPRRLFSQSGRFWDPPPKNELKIGVPSHFKRKTTFFDNKTQRN